MIFPVYQPLGSSSHQLAAKLGQQLHEPTTHTGTLDPMAEGVLLCLSGDERFKKEEYTQYDKEYVFTVLVGFETDSDDLLGIVTSQQVSSKPTKLSNTFLTSFTGTQQQELHPFSAKRLDGESFFDKAKRGESLPTTTQNITIHSLELLSSKTITSRVLMSEVEKRINLVKGDFRQPEVILSWQQALKKHSFSDADSSQEYQLLTLKTTCSKRTYIRSLVRDFARAVHQPLTTFHILRTKNGPYQIADCLCLV